MCFVLLALTFEPCCLGWRVRVRLATCPRFWTLFLHHWVFWSGLRTWTTSVCRPSFLACVIMNTKGETWLRAPRQLKAENQRSQGGSDPDISLPRNRLGPQQQPVFSPLIYGRRWITSFHRSFSLGFTTGGLQTPSPSSVLGTGAATTESCLWWVQVNPLLTESALTWDLVQTGTDPEPAPYR